MSKVILLDACCNAVKDHQLQMISFRYQAGATAPITAQFVIDRGVITVSYEGMSKSAPISSDAAATVAIRNELLRAIMIERAMKLAPVPKGGA